MPAMSLRFLVDPVWFFSSVSSWSCTWFYHHFHPNPLGDATVLFLFLGQGSLDPESREKTWQGTVNRTRHDGREEERAYTGSKPLIKGLKITYFSTSWEPESYHLISLLTRLLLRSLLPGQLEIAPWPLKSWCDIDPVPSLLFLWASFSLSVKWG